MFTKIIEQMKTYFGQDKKRIDHALAVLNQAEQILTTEPNACSLVVQAGAILHDIGIHNAEKKYNSTAAKYQELEGPPIARKILEDLKMPAEDIEHICRIVGSHHTAKDIDTIEFRIVYDADLLVNIKENGITKNYDQVSELVDKKFKTQCGKQIAKKFLERK